MNKVLVSGTVIALLVGVAFGVFLFPRTTTLTTTQVSTATQTITYQVTLSSTVSAKTAASYPVVTFTAVIVDVYFFSPECTTISGTPIVTYTNGPGGQTTTVVTISNSSLPQQYIATVTTDHATFSASFTTLPFTGTCK